MNNFQEWQKLFEEDLPLEIEDKLVAQANTFQHFANVTELFVPNALQTVVNMLGASGNDPAAGQIDWRKPPAGPAPRPEPARNTLQNPR